MRDVDIRRATRADAECLATLIEPLQSLHAALRPSIFKPLPDAAAVQSFFEERLSESNTAIGIADVDGVAVGYVYFELQPHAENMFMRRLPRAFIHHLSVAPDLRRNGVATALIRYVEAHAAAAGCVEIALETWSFNTNAQHFFDARGFAHQRLEFRKAVRVE